MKKQIHRDIIHALIFQDFANNVLDFNLIMQIAQDLRGTRKIKNK